MKLVDRLHCRPSEANSCSACGYWSDHDGECGALIVGDDEDHDDQDAIWLQDRKKPTGNHRDELPGRPRPGRNRISNPRLYPATWIR